MLNTDGTVQPSGLGFPGLLNLALLASGLPRVFPRSRWFARGTMTWWTFDAPREMEVIKGCFLLIRREALQRVGLLDERFFMYAEEVDWCMRLRRAGGRVLFAPCGSIIHHGGASTAPVARAMIPLLWGGMLAFVGKYHSRPYQAACALCVAVFLGLRIPPLLALGVAQPRLRRRGLVYLTTLADLLRGGSRRLCRVRPPEAGASVGTA